MRARRVPALQAAIAVGIPLVGFALVGEVASGALASLGALAVLYAPGLLHPRRVLWVLGTGAALVVAAAAGALGAGSGSGTVAVIALVSGIGVVLSRWLSVAPPGALMPVLVCATSTQIPLASAPLTARVGLVAVGAAIACLVVMAGGLFRGCSAGAAARADAPQPSAPAPAW